LAKKKQAESDTEFTTRRKRAASSAALQFVDGTSEVKETCFVRPGAKNQPHSDGLLIFEIKEEKASAAQTDLQPSLFGLGFVQNKFSASGSTTSTLAKDIVDALHKLVKDRGILFVGGGQDITDDTKNQIAQLGVLEKNVFLCFTSLRSCSNKMEAVRAAADDVGFEGSILVTDGKKGCRQFFGSSFANLALLGVENSPEAGTGREGKKQVRG
jgi:hypothetical protein